MMNDTLTKCLSGLKFSSDSSDGKLYNMVVKISKVLIDKESTYKPDSPEHEAFAKGVQITVLATMIGVFDKTGFKK